MQIWRRKKGGTSHTFVYRQDRARCKWKCAWPLLPTANYRRSQQRFLRRETSVFRTANTLTSTTSAGDWRYLTAKRGAALYMEVTPIWCTRSLTYSYYPRPDSIWTAGGCTACMPWV